MESAFKDLASTPEGVDKQIRSSLIYLIMNAVKNDKGNFRPSEAISAAATMVAERCIDAVGFPVLRDHDFPPGSRALSQRINEITLGDVTDAKPQDWPQGSVIQILRANLDPAIYLDSEFPEMRSIVQGFISGVTVSKPEEWGRTPLSIDRKFWPQILPLQFGYESRKFVDLVMKPIGDDKLRAVRIATEALAKLLMHVAKSIDHRIALTLALETINGMSKTAPMTEKAMAKAQSNQRDKT